MGEQATTKGRAFDQLVEIVQDLSQARTVNAISAIVRSAARALTGADGATFVLRDGDNCHYADEDAIAPLWKGKRFPMETCISGWVMLNKSPAVIEDIYVDPRIPHEAYRPTFVKSLAMVPIRRSAPIGAIGNYWSVRYAPSFDDIAVLQALADSTSVAMENALLYTDLQQKIEIPSQREAQIKSQHDTLEMFARSLAHDLREPVRTVRAFSAMLTARDAREEEYLRFVRGAGDRMGMLIDTVYQFIQLDGAESTPMESFPLAEAVAAARANLARLFDERGATIAGGPLPNVHANRTQMVQVFQNLLANAITHNASRVHIDIAARQTDGRFEITVRDNGAGVPDGCHERVFEPFRRLSHGDGNAGLGLSICRKIIELHGGTIAYTRDQNGAGFTLTLPRAAAPSIAADATPEPAAESQSHDLATVLIVDDREPDLHLTRTLITAPVGAHCEVLVARDGREGLDLIRKTQAAGGAIDLVLLDINMPVMNGFEMLEQMIADPALRAIPVVMCSGSDYQRDKDRAAELGAVGYMEKPARFDKLMPLLAPVSTISLVKDAEGLPALTRAA